MVRRQLFVNPVQELNCAYFFGEIPTAFGKAFKKLL